MTRGYGCANLRLAVVSPFVDRRHGTERALAELLERLARKEHCEIHLYAQRVEDLALDQPGVAHTQESGLIIWHKVPSIPGPHLLQFLAWLFLNSIRRAWDRWVHGLRFDLVVSPGINCLDADVVIVHALFYRLQQLAHQEDLGPAKPSLLRRLHRRAYYALLAGLERRIYADPRVSLAAVSQRTAALLSKYFHRQDVTVIPNGVDTAHFSPSARLARREPARTRRQFRQEDFVLLLIGNDLNNKGLPAVLEAISVQLEIPARLIIVGDDPTSAPRELAQRLRVFDRCFWEPATSDILDAYAAADLYVSPSREDSFGMPVAEAMACGLPVITSVLAGISSLLHDGVDSLILRDPHDAKTLATMIRALYQKAEWRSRMGQAAARASLEWTWDRNATAVWELLKDAARKLPSPARRR
jgi:glycosyltransferase involved in cell wall biosynthesis